MAKYVPNEDLIRVNIRISKDVKNYYTTRSKQTGVSMTALMYLALEKAMREETFMKTGLPQLLKMAKEHGISTPEMESMSEAFLDAERA